MTKTFILIITDDGKFTNFDTDNKGFTDTEIIGNLFKYQISITNPFKMNKKKKKTSSKIEETQEVLWNEAEKIINSGKYTTLQELELKYIIKRKRSWK